MGALPVGGAYDSHGGTAFPCHVGRSAESEARNKFNRYEDAILGLCDLQIAADPVRIARRRREADAEARRKQNAKDVATWLKRQPELEERKKKKEAEAAAARKAALAKARAPKVPRPPKVPFAPMPDEQVAVADLAIAHQKEFGCWPSVMTDPSATGGMVRRAVSRRLWGGR